MKKQKFEEVYINALKNLNIEGVVGILNKEKETKNPNKLINFLNSIKSKITKKEISNISLLANDYDAEHKLSTDLLNEAMKQKRLDVVLYLIKNKYYVEILSDIYFAEIVKDKEVLKEVLSSQIEINPNNYIRMLKECVYKSNLESFKTLISYEKDIDKIDLLDKQKLLMETVYRKENKFFDFLVQDNKWLNSFNFELETEHYGITQEPDNILLGAARTKNYEILEKVLKQEDKFELKIEKSIGWILSYLHQEEIMDEVIMKIKYPLTKDLENELNRLGESKYIDIFTKRDLLISLEEKLEIKNIKSNKNKI